LPRPIVYHCRFNRISSAAIMTVGTIKGVMGMHRFMTNQNVTSVITKQMALAKTS
jgi:TM2 domain-containing membrane protein YozV